MDVDSVLGTTNVVAWAYCGNCCATAVGIAPVVNGIPAPSAPDTAADVTDIVAFLELYKVYVEPAGALGQTMVCGLSQIACAVLIATVLGVELTGDELLEPPPPPPPPQADRVTHIISILDNAIKDVFIERRMGSFSINQSN